MRLERRPGTSSRVEGADVSRRDALKMLAALGLIAFPHAVRPDQGGAGVPDLCASAADAARTRLFIPGAGGFLARLAPGGQPLVLVAGAAPRLPPDVVHGPNAYEVRLGSRRYFNPMLAVKRGEKLRITLENRLNAPTITHWHGLGVDTRNDGAGMPLVAPGEQYEYAFEVRDRAALYWYHPHPHGATAGQVYSGLYGLIDVEDEDEIRLRRALDLAPGKTELALVLQDRRAPPGVPGTADMIHGFFGDDLYVNGSHCAFHDVATRIYRLRLLNACNARTLRLAFRTTSGARLPFTLIGNDGGLLRSPVRAEQAFLATAERLDVLLDLSEAPVGETIVMETLAFDPMHAELAQARGSDADATNAEPAANDEAPASKPRDGSVDHAAMGHAMSDSADHAAHIHGGSWPDGGARALLVFRVRQRVAYDRRIPAELARIEAIDVTGARERPLRLGFNHGRWRINDRVFVIGETPIQAARDTTEIWLIRNYHTSMPHAMHLHGFHFEVLERETSPEFIAALAVDKQGRLPSDLGRKDTVLVWPGESVRIAIRFALSFPDPQTYMFHCHNLEHEDGGMMLGVRVG